MHHFHDRMPKGAFARLRDRQEGCSRGQSCGWTVAAGQGGSGYDKAPEIAHLAMEQDLTLKDATIRSGEVAEAECDRVVDPMSLVGEGLAGS